MEKEDKGWRLHIKYCGQGKYQNLLEEGSGPHGCLGQGENPVRGRSEGEGPMGARWVYLRNSKKE